MTISIQQQRHGHRRPLACSVGAVLTTALLATTLGLPLAVPAQAQAQSSPNASAEVSGESAAKDAVTQARRSGKPVGVDAFTTPTTTLTANPSGTFTLDQSLHPVRIRRHGKWVPVDASLHRTPDGTLTPAAVPSPVTLSGGGSKTLATLSSHGKSLAVSWPNPLPAPIVAGDTATYPEVLPGVDLKATVSSLGGFSEVLVIKNATAASNPKLDRLVLGTSGPSLTVSADSAGSFRATDASGAVRFASPAPLMWDSSALQTVTGGKAPLIGDATPPTMADTSSPAAPGRGAHIAPIPTRATANTVTLTLTKKCCADRTRTIRSTLIPPGIPSLPTIRSRRTTRSRKAALTRTP